MSKGSPRPLVVKTTVNLPKETLDIAKDMAAQRNASISDVVRGAIDLHALITEATKSGHKVLLQSPDEKVREIIILH